MNHTNPPPRPVKALLWGIDWCFGFVEFGIPKFYDHE